MSDKTGIKTSRPFTMLLCAVLFFPAVAWMHGYEDLKCRNQTPPDYSRNIAVNTYNIVKAPRYWSKKDLLTFFSVP